MGQGLLLIPLVCVSLVNIGSGFSIKIWILVFLGKYSNFFLGLKACLLGFASFGIRAQVKISFLSLFSFVSYHPILFLLCSLFFVLILWRALGQNRAPSPKKKKRLQKRNRKQKKILFVVSILSNQNIIFFCLLPLI